MKLFAVFALAGVLWLAYFYFSQVSAGAGSAPEIKAIAKGYRKLRLMTPEIVNVDAEIAASCFVATKSMVEAESLVSGPHAHAVIRIYMNDRASRGFEKSSVPYPMGSVIVKEKYFYPYNEEGKQVLRENGVGGMVKREPGYDPEHGDWEYFYFTSVDEIEAGRIVSCISCHQQVGSTDYVFGTWHE